MDLSDFPSNLEHLGPFGFTLNPEQRASMQASLQQLKNNYKFSRVVFWGRVSGHSRDYYIAQGFESTLLRGKRTFVSQSLTKWAQLPEVSEAQRVRSEGLNGLYTGDLSYQYVIVEEVMPWEPPKEKKVRDSDDEESEEESEDEIVGEDDEEEEEDELEEGATYRKLPKKKTKLRRHRVTEEVRLAALVNAIDDDTSVIPRGAALIDQGDRVSMNSHFEGLSEKEAGNLSFYLHFRAPRVVPKKTLLEKSRLNMAIDFLDRIDEDVPSGSWSIQYDGTGSTASIRSLVWPGYTAYHCPGSRRFGSVYVGNGVKNADIGFML